MTDCAPRAASCARCRTCPASACSSTSTTTARRTRSARPTSTPTCARRWASISPPRTSAPGTPACSPCGLLAEAEGLLTLKELTAEVGEHLGNTPAMARKSYIHPAVIALVERQPKWRARLKLPREGKWLDRYERALIKLLENSPKAGRLLA